MKHQYSQFTNELNALSIGQINDLIKEIEQNIKEIEDELMNIPERSRLANILMADIIRLQKQKGLCRDEIIKKKRINLNVNGKALKYGLYTDVDNKSINRNNSGRGLVLRGVTL